MSRRLVLADDLSPLLLIIITYQIPAACARAENPGACDGRGLLASISRLDMGYQDQSRNC